MTHEPSLLAHSQPVLGLRATLLTLLAPVALAALSALCACSGDSPSLSRSRGPALGVPDEIEDKRPGKTAKPKSVPAPGKLSVRLSAPNGETREASEVSVVFDRPMVVIGRDGKLPTPTSALPIRFEPAEPFNEVSASWLTANTLVVKPKKLLPAATEFRGIVAAGTQSADGSPLPQEYVFTFATPRPRPINWSPYSYSRWQKPDSTIVVKFNQAIDLGVLQQKTTVASRPADEPTLRTRRRRARTPEPVVPGKPIAFTIAAVPGAANEHAFKITPKEALPLDSKIEVEIAADLVGLEGPRSLSTAAEHTFFTYGPLRADLDCTSDCSPESSLRLRVTNRVKRKDLMAAVHVTPPLKAEEGASDQLVRDVSFSGLTPETTYQVSFSGDVKDEFGNAYAGSRTFAMKVASREPRSTLQSGGIVEAGGTRKLWLRLQNLKAVEVRQLRVTEDRAIELVKKFDTAKVFEPVLKSESGAVSYELASTRPPSQRDRVMVELDRGLGPEHRGLVAIETFAPGEESAKGKPVYHRRFIRVTDLGITLKLTPYETVAWVTSLATGRPAGQAKVSIRDGESGKLLWSGEADADGLARGPGLRKLGLKPPKTYVFASLGQDTSFVKGDDQEGIRPGDFGMYANSRWDDEGGGDYGNPDVPRSDANLGYAFTSRGLYRPGETVFVKGILRIARKEGLETPKGAQAELVVKNSSDEELVRRLVPLSEFGTFNQEVVLPVSAKLGGYRAQISLRLPSTESPKAAKDGGSQATEPEKMPVTASVSFEVQEFRPAEFTAKAKIDKASILPGDPISVEVSGRYLFGGAMAGAKVSYHIERRASSFSPPGAGAFTFSDTSWFTTFKAPSSNVLSGEDKMSTSGELKIPVEGKSTNLAAMRGPETLNFEATVTDPGGQSTGASAQVLVHPGDYYVGLRPAETFQELKKPLVFDVLAVKPDGVHLDGRKIAVEVVRRQWDTVLRTTQNNGPRYETEIKHIPVGSCQLTSAAKEARCEVTVNKPGYYLARASSTDDKKRTVASSTSVYVTGSGWAAWPVPNEPRVELVANKTSYTPGDTARVLVKSPYPSADALVTVEREGIFTRHRVHLVGSGGTLEVPVKPEYAPGVFVSVVLVRGRQPDPADVAGGDGSGKPAVAVPLPKKDEDVGKPAFKVGYVRLPVSYEGHRLKVEVSADAPKKRPGQDLTISVKVSDAKSQPVRSEVAIFAVDEGVLLLSGFRTPDPLPSFFTDRPLGVLTADNRVDVADLNKDGAEKGDETPGDGGGKSGSTRVRRKFVADAFYNGAVVTGSDGVAKVTFKLPDNLTTFRLMAVAVSAGAEFGSGDAQIQVSQPLVLRPALPRFIRVGDRFEGGVVVHNETGSPGVAKVTASATGVELVGAADRELTLGVGEVGQARFTINAPTAGPSTIKFSVVHTPSDGQKPESDAVELEKAVQAPATFETVAIEGETEAGVIEKLGPLRGIRKDLGGLEITVGTTPLERLNGGIESLLEYPYGCLEQTTSKLVPLIAAKELIDAFGVTVKSSLKPDLKTVAQNGVDRLHKFARGNGGMSLWIGADDVKPYYTAIGLWGLHVAKTAGYRVDPLVITRATEFLKKSLRTEQSPTSAAKSYELAERAFLLRVLAEVGGPEPAYAAELYAERDKLPFFARADLMVAMHLGLGDAKAVLELKKGLIGKAILRQNGSAGYQGDNYGEYSGLFSSDVRTSAAVAEALSIVDPEEPFTARLAKGLLSLRKGGSWRNTQENAYAVRALWRVYGKKALHAADFEAVVSFAAAESSQSERGNPVFKAQLKGTEFKVAKYFIPMATLLAGPAERKLIVERRGQGRLFYTARLKFVRDPVPTFGRDAGLHVERRYEAVSLVDGEPIARPIKADEGVKMGQMVRVTLTVVAPESQDFVAIDDPLPAGLEAINFELRNVSPQWRRMLRAKSLEPEKNENGEPVEASDGAGDDGDGDRMGRESSTWYVHRELRDDRVLIFSDDMDAGVHRFVYLTQATTPGSYTLAPMKGEAMYAPEIYGRTGGRRFTISEAPPQ